MAETLGASDISALLKRFESLANDVPKDESVRKPLFEAARNLAFALESPGDTIQRISYLPLQLTIARVSADIGLPEILANSTAPSMGIEELAKHTSTDTVLLRRLLRFLASFGMVKEVSENHFAATNITRTLTVPGLKAGIYHNFDIMMPCYQQLPSFLASTKYQNPMNPFKSPFQVAHNTDLPPFVWIQSHPANMDYFIQWMTSQREGQKIWLDVYPFEQNLCQNLDPDTPLFVDIGGGIGHQCLALKTRFPNVSGRVILQDLPSVVAQAIATPGIEPMPHDFNTPQPIRGARAYYMRNILHDYPDETCKVILQLTREAMGKDSVILIDEMVLPDQRIYWQAAQLDIAMMSSLSAMERSKKQWYKLLESAGLKIVQIYTYTEELQDSILVAVPK